MVVALGGILSHCNAIRSKSTCTLDKCAKQSVQKLAAIRKTWSQQQQKDLYKLATDSDQLLQQINELREANDRDRARIDELRKTSEEQSLELWQVEQHLASLQSASAVMRQQLAEASAEHACLQKDVGARIGLNTAMRIRMRTATEDFSDVCKRITAVEKEYASKLSTLVALEDELQMTSQRSAYMERVVMCARSHAVSLEANVTAAGLRGDAMLRELDACRETVSAITSDLKAKVAMLDAV